MKASRYPLRVSVSLSACALLALSFACEKGGSEAPAKPQATQPEKKVAAEKKTAAAKAPKSDTASAAKAAGPAPKELIVGMLPFTNKDEIWKVWAPVLSHISKHVGVPVKLNVAENYAGLTESLVAGEVHVANLSPYLYLKTRKKMGGNLRVIAHLAKPQGQFYRGALVVRQNSAYQKIADLEGKTIAYVDENSSSGYFFPRRYVLAQNVSPDKHFGRNFFAGSHDAVIDAVNRGEADVGAVWEEVAQRAVKQGKRLRVLGTSELIPPDAVAVRTDLPDKVIAGIRDAMTSVHTLPPELVQPLFDKMRSTGWRRAESSDYDDLATALDEMGEGSTAGTSAGALPKGDEIPSIDAPDGLDLEGDGKAPAPKAKQPESAPAHSP